MEGSRKLVISMIESFKVQQNNGKDSVAYILCRKEYDPLTHRRTPHGDSS